MARVRLTYEEWLGLREYNRRMLELWIPGEGYDRAIEVLLAARPRILREVAEAGFDLPPLMVEELIRREVRPSLLTERLREVA